MFFVRHAQSKWNRHLEDIRRAPQILSDPSQAKPALQGAVALTKEISQGLIQEGHTDHKLSELGEKQARELRAAMAEEAQQKGRDRPAYYEHLLTGLPVYCSPMLRAVQTAHLALPEDAGWGPIILLKDAREVFSNWAERDCVGVVAGRGIVERAMQECELPGLAERVDWSQSDCEEGQWWSATVEAEYAVNERLDALLRRLLDEDKGKSCICVTHSNLIRRLMMRHGAVGCEAPGPGPMGGLEVPLVREPSSRFDLAARSFTSETSWEELHCTPAMLQRCKVEKLQNCGVLGVRFVRERQGWVARDVSMMFGSKLEPDLGQ